MSDLWWRMPGPARYVAGALEQLHDGKNVVLCVPDHLPDGLARAVVQAQPAPWGRAWELLRVRASTNSTPVDLLFRRFAPDAAAATLRNAAALVREPQFTRRLIWLERMSSTTWPAWKAFLEEYEHACRARLPDERSLFCIMLAGEPAASPPVAGVSLAVARWRGIASELDTLLYTSLVFPERPLTGVKRNVAVAVVAALALWDPHICDYLARQPLRTIFAPCESLRRFAHERGWEQPGGTNLWCAGMVDTFADQERQHSAHLALCGQIDELNHRVWRGQMSVLYPMIEERRQQLLLELRDLLHVPFRTREGAQITQLHDLEIGHIEWQLAEHRRNGRPDPRLETTFRQVSALKTMRNHLAHLESVREEQIQL